MSTDKKIPAKISDFGYQVDSLARCTNDHISPDLLFVSVSNLTGNIWNSWLLLCDSKSISSDGAFELIYSLEVPCGTAEICWENKSNVLIAAEDSGDVKIYDARNSDGAVHLTPVATLGDHDNIVSSVAAFQESSYIVSGSWDHTVKLWDLSYISESNPNTSSCVCTISEHSHHINAVACGNNSRSLVCSASMDYTVRLWDSRLQPIGSNSIFNFAFEFVPYSLSFSPSEDNTIAVGTELGSVVLLDTRMVMSNSREKAQSAVFEICNAPIRSLRFSPDGKCIGIGSDDGHVNVLQRDPKNNISEKAVQLQPHFDYCRAISWDSKTENSLVSGGWDCSIKLQHLNVAGS